MDGGGVGVVDVAVGRKLGERVVEPAEVEPAEVESSEGGSLLIVGWPCLDNAEEFKVAVLGGTNPGCDAERWTLGDDVFRTPVPIGVESTKLAVVAVLGFDDG